MFCPNCGKDCGDGKFCSECGTQLQQSAKKDTQQTEWKVGMACPHCGGTKLEGIYCAFCGAQLIADLQSTETEEEDSYELPFRKYRAVWASIHIAKEELVVEKDGFLKKKVYRIPYNQLTSVVFARNENLYGTMTFYWNNGVHAGSNVRNTPNIGSVTVSLGFDDNCAYYYHVFYIIKLLAPASVDFSTHFANADKECLERFSHCTDLDDYFKRFNPYRERAISAFSREKAIPQKDARALIDALFNERQKELYEAEPSLAARDYNRMIKERHRIFEEKYKEREERSVSRHR